jgi:hypothetical protein
MEITGTEGNPLAVIVKQLRLATHKLLETCPLLDSHGEPFDMDLDRHVDRVHNALLEASKGVSNAQSQKERGQRTAKAAERRRQQQVAAVAASAADGVSAGTAQGPVPMDDDDDGYLETETEHEMAGADMDAAAGAGVQLNEQAEADAVRLDEGDLDDSSLGTMLSQLFESWANPAQQSASAATSLRAPPLAYAGPAGVGAAASERGRALLSWHWANLEVLNDPLLLHILCT